MADLSSLARRPLLRLAAAATAASVMFGAWVGAMFFAAPRPPEVRTFAAAESPSLAESLRVLSYNVWGVPNIVNDDAGRLPTLLTHLDSYDIVGVQEMFTREAVEQISKAPFPYRLLARGEGGSFDKFSSGLAILSRLPIREAVEVEYHSCLRFDCTARKGALLGRVRVDAAHDVDVWVTHLQAGDDAEGEAVRVAQLEELGAYVSQYDIGNPIIFLGDFNSEPGGQAHAQMVRLLSRRDAWVEWVERQASAALGHTFSADNVWNPGIRSQRIDYVLLRAGRAFDWQVGGAALAFSQPIGGRHLSDHFGVSAVLALQRVLAAR